MLRLFRRQDKAARTTRAESELALTLIDFLAALCFLIGSVLFFWGSTQFAATWLFVIGSLFFCAGPSLKLLRELRLAAKGDTEELADRFDP